MRHYHRESLEFQATILHVFSHYFAKSRGRRQPTQAISKACSNVHRCCLQKSPRKYGSWAREKNSYVISNTQFVAEREGFEPPVRLRVLRISSAARSTTLPPLRGRRRRLEASRARSAGRLAWPTRARKAFGRTGLRGGRDIRRRITPPFRRPPSPGAP